MHCVFLLVYVHRQALGFLLSDVLPHVLRLMPQELVSAFMIHLIGANDLPSDLKTLVGTFPEHVRSHGWMGKAELQQLFDQVRMYRNPTSCLHFCTSAPL